MSEFPTAIESLALMLARLCEAQAMAVWAHSGGHVEVVASSRMLQAHYNLMHEVWRHDRLELQEGRVVQRDAVAFAPLMSPRFDLVGVIELLGQLPKEGPRKLVVDDTARQIARLLLTPVSPAEPGALTLPLSLLEMPGGAEEADRAMYGALLDRYGWNVTLVAGMLDIPRQTLQNRLAALDMKRPRPSPKERRKRSASSVVFDLTDAVRATLWPRAAGVPRKPRG